MKNLITNKTVQVHPNETLDIQQTGSVSVTCVQIFSDKHAQKQNAHLVNREYSTKICSGGYQFSRCFAITAFANGHYVEMSTDNASSTPCFAKCGAFFEKAQKRFHYPMQPQRKT